MRKICEKYATYMPKKNVHNAIILMACKKNMQKISKIYDNMQKFAEYMQEYAKNMHNMQIYALHHHHHRCSVKAEEARCCDKI